MKLAKAARFGAVAMVAASMISMTTGCCGTATCKQQKETMIVNNADFYTAEGTLDTAKAKQAYFSMMEKLGAPVYDVYRPDDGFLWTVDFGHKNFAQFGMGGVFWVNDGEKGYFAHEIFLLPGQSIAEHRHLPTKDEKGKDVQAKYESWQVRYGSVYAFCEATKDLPANLDEYPEIKAKLYDTQLQHLKSWHVEKWVADGKLHHLLEIPGHEPTWHFMMGGEEGAVVSEYATYHHNSGLRFTCPNTAL
jgi:hypothetical protein